MADTNDKLNISRRTFLQASATLAGASALGAVFVKGKKVTAQTTGQNPTDTLESDDDVSVIYSVCQMCHSRCGIQCKVKNGILTKIDGNPYHPNNLDPDEMLPYDTSTEDAKLVRGRLCLKGQSGIQTLYDPYRIKQPLKRVGDRGSGQWEAISWATAFAEIAAAINAQIDFTNRVTTAIDSNFPEKGYIANQLVFSPGRSIEKELSERIWYKSYGTINYGLDHTSICEVSHHVVNELNTWDGGKKSHFKPDILGAEYTLHFGSNPCEAGFPMLALARKLMNAKNESGATFAVVDPRLSNSAAKANQWVPAKPGTDGAVALGMARSIIDNEAYDSTYLTNPNSTAAVADGERTFTDATWLVDTSTGYYLNSAQAGLVSTTLTAAVTYSGTTLTVASTSGFPTSGSLRVGNEAILYTGTTSTTFTGLTRGGNASVPADHSSGDTVSMAYVCLQDGSPALAESASSGDLEVDTTVEGVAVKSVFTLLAERVQERTVAEYATIAGLDESTITGLATEFTSHGKKAVANAYRGTVQHTNGAYSMMAVMALNTLIGNYDWKGGNSVGGGSWGHTTGAYTLATVSTGGVTAKGLRMDRAKLISGYKTTDGHTDYDYEDSALFARDGYPAQRPWFKFGSHGNFQEVIPSAADEYPYPLKVLITYWNAWPYSTPALKTVFENYVSDTSKLPLFVSISPVMGEVSAWADYILPDSTYLEKWSVPGMTPTILTKATSIQQPVVGSYDGTTIGGEAGWTFDSSAANEYVPYLADTKTVADIHIGLATALGLAGAGMGVDTSNFTNAWGWYSLVFDNLASTSGESVDEIISKGGVFQDPGNEYTGDYLTNGYGSATTAKIVHLYIEAFATSKDTMTGEYFDGLPKYEEPKHADDSAINDGSGYPYQLITYKSVRHGQGRTNVNPWLMMLQPENFVELNATDASSLGVVTGDEVRVTSPSNTSGITGKARVTEGLRPGVVAISHHYGHWQNSSTPHMVDGIEQGYDATRGKGLQPTLVMRLDSTLGNVSLQDKIGGSCSFYDTWVNVAKVA